LLTSAGLSNRGDLAGVSVLAWAEFVGVGAADAAAEEASVDVVSVALVSFSLSAFLDFLEGSLEVESAESLVSEVLVFDDFFVLSFDFVFSFSPFSFNLAFEDD